MKVQTFEILREEDYAKSRQIKFESFVKPENANVPAGQSRQVSGRILAGNGEAVREFDVYDDMLTFMREQSLTGRAYVKGFDVQPKYFDSVQQARTYVVLSLTKAGEDCIVRIWDYTHESQDTQQSPLTGDYLNGQKGFWQPAWLDEDGVGHNYTFISNQ